MSAPTPLGDEVLSRLSHELRTPLMSMKWGVNLLIENALGPTTRKQQEFLKTMEASIDHLTSLITNMLDLAKIEAGHMRLKRQRLDVAAVIEAVVRTVHPLLGYRRLHTELAPVPPVFGDATTLFQVALNLVANAIKFTADDGCITIHVAQRQQFVAVAVEDNGVGMAPEDLPKLFHKFTQLERQEGHHPGGAGLGLVVCKELVELHQGRIEVVSELRRGTTFTVLLPIYLESVALAARFQELMTAPRKPQDVIGLIAVDLSGAWAVTEDTTQQPHQHQDEFIQQIRQHVRPRDVVLPMTLPWVVVMIITSPDGPALVAQRLRDALPQGAQLRFGMATHPADGPTADALFATAQQRVGLLLLR